MVEYRINPVDHKNAGIAREWALCAYYKVERHKHDNVSYDKGSDLDVENKHISIKASGFSLMAGSLCEGRTDFTSIWDLYAERVHSNTFAYVTKTFEVFEMTLAEFKEFIYAFGALERESESNGGQLKIRCRKESGKMLKWLEARI